MGRSSRSSSTLGERQSSVVDTDMGDEVDKVEETEKSNVEVEDTSPKDKNDIGCKQCLLEGEPSKPIHKKASQVRFNEVVETREVETEYDKPSRTGAYIQGFFKRVIICTVILMVGKSVWPHLRPLQEAEARLGEAGQTARGGGSQHCQAGLHHQQGHVRQVQRQGISHTTLLQEWRDD